MKGASHEAETPFLRYLLAEDDLCLHVGASDGRHSYEMSRYIPRGHIYAFEPSSYSFRVFQRLIALHRLTRVTAYHCAIGDTEGTLNLVVPVKRNGHIGRSFGFVSFDPAANRADAQGRPTFVEQVAVHTLDAFCDSNTGGRVDLIRCDVEGAEMGVLRGASQILTKNLPTLLLEIHPPMLAEHFNTTGEAVRDYLLAMGYRMFRLEGEQVVEDTALVDAPWKDYFFIHPSRAQRLPEGPFRRLMQA